MTLILVSIILSVNNLTCWYCMFFQLLFVLILIFVKMCNWLDSEIEDFNSISSRLLPMELISVLNVIYKTFDSKIDKFQVLTRRSLHSPPPPFRKLKDPGAHTGASTEPAPLLQVLTRRSIYSRCYYSMPSSPRGKLKVWVKTVGVSLKTGIFLWKPGFFFENFKNYFFLWKLGYFAKMWSFLDFHIKTLTFQLGFLQDF